MSFESELESKRFHELHAWMEKRAVGWNYRPLEVGGNFISEHWCGPNVHPNLPNLCVWRSLTDEPGTAWMSLGVLHYRLPEVFGMEVHIVHYQKEAGGLALRFYVSEGGKTILGNVMTATFLLSEKSGYDINMFLDEGKGVSIGTSMTIRVADTELGTGSRNETWREALRKMAASPQSLEAFAMSEFDALQTRVDNALAKNQVMGFDEGPYLGGGIPPERTPRYLTPAEKKREAKAAKASIDSRKAFVAKHAAAMHALLVAEVPVELLLH